MSRYDAVGVVGLYSLTTTVGVVDFHSFCFCSERLVATPAKTMDLLIAAGPVMIDARVPATKHNIPTNNIREKGKPEKRIRGKS